MTSDPERAYYNIRRAWVVMSKLSPSLNLDPDKKEFPLFVKADKVIDVRSVMKSLRDLFENTPFEAFPEGGGIGGERPVCVPSCIHSAVVETRGHMPADIGGVLWGCIGSPMTSPYIPHYLAHQNLLPAYTQGGLEYDPDSAFWRFRLLTNLVMSDYREYALAVSETWNALEKNIFAAKTVIEQEVVTLFKENENAAKLLLTSFSNAYDALACEEARKLGMELQTRIAERQYLHFAKTGLEW
jgi:dipeptidase